MEADEKIDYQEEYTERIDAKTNKLSTISMSCMLSVWRNTTTTPHAYINTTRILFIVIIATVKIMYAGDLLNESLSK